MATPYNSNYQPASQAASSSYQSYQQLGSHAVNVEGGNVQPTPGDANEGQRISRYETSINLRPDAEAGLAYALGCITGVALLILERKNDYVRYHAWQSCMLSAAAFIAIIILAIISHTLSWIMFLAFLIISVYMGRRAYIDGATFYRFQLPYIGSMAADWVDCE
ncbi:hypothetical protein H4219_000711 [Mycoemilia scoparia]|uniref:Uncharacterized protein n=1 Tax=Mycoemilia scoparia TaxID=417184 RepID=A0A9W8ABE2_9FUNG|nr:hypothetical protein H4219_000711 [Mycoemilia scoparia]